MRKWMLFMWRSKVISEAGYTLRYFPVRLEKEQKKLGDIAKSRDLVFHLTMDSDVSLELSSVDLINGKSILVIK